MHDPWCLITKISAPIFGTIAVWLLLHILRMGEGAEERKTDDPLE